MNSDASNDFFWQEMQSNDSGSELQIQRITLEGLVGTTVSFSAVVFCLMPFQFISPLPQDQEQTIGLQAEDTAPSGLVSTNANNNRDRLVSNFSCYIGAYCREYEAYF